MTDQEVFLGSWPNAPLALVVAQVRHRPVGDSIEALAQRFRDRQSNLFSGMYPLQGISLMLGDTGVMHPPSMTVNGFDLRNDDGRRCLRIQEGVLTYHTSIYGGSQAFNTEWRVLLEILEQAAGGSIIAGRLGLRYVDFIFPRTPDGTPESYFVPGFAAAPVLSGGEAPLRMTLMEYPRDNDAGRLRIQYARGFGEPSLPLDLGEAASAPRELCGRYLGGLSATLDTDRWRMLNDAPLSAAALGETFKSMQDDIRDAFHAITTQEARRYWGEKQEVRA